MTIFLFLVGPNLTVNENFRFIQGDKNKWTIKRRPKQRSYRIKSKKTSLLTNFVEKIKKNEASFIIGNYLSSRTDLTH